MDAPSFSNLIGYFCVCGAGFLAAAVAFCLYKNLRTLPTATALPHNSSILLPALPEADLYLTDLIRHVYSHNDVALRQDVKVEGLIYIEFHRYLLLICSAMCATGAIVLVPTYLEGSSGEEAWNISCFAITHIHDHRWLLWIAVGVVILFSIMMTYLMFRFQARVRYELLHSDGGVASRTLELSNLPPHSNTAVLGELLNSVLQVQFPPPINTPNPIEVIMVVPDLNLAYSILLKLKRALKIRKYYMEREEVEGKTIMRKPVMGRRVPMVEYYNKKVADLQTQYKETMSLHQQSLGVAFVTLRSRSLMLYLYKNFNRRAVPPDLSPGKWRVRKAPNPKEILWANLTKPKVSGTIIANAIFVAVFFVVLTPLAFQDQVRKALDWLKLSSALQSWIVPVMIYAYQQIILRKVVLFLVKSERHTRASHASVSIFYKYYLFSLVYGYVLPMLGIQTAHVLLQWFIDHDKNWTELLGSAVRLSSFTFTQVVINHTFVGNGLDLLQHSKYINAVFRAAKAKLPDDKVRAFEAEDFPFGSSYAECLGVLLLVCSYSVIYPLILPFGLLHFALRVSPTQLAIQKYNILCFYVVRFDSFGRVAKHVSVALAVAVFAMQALTLLTIMIIDKTEIYAVCGCLLAVACVQLPLTVILSRRRRQQSEEDHQTLLLTSELVAQSYRHPCLHTEED